MWVHRISSVGTIEFASLGKLMFHRGITIQRDWKLILTSIDVKPSG